MHRFLGRLKAAKKGMDVWTLEMVEQFIRDDLAREAEDKESRKKRKEAERAARKAAAEKAAAEKAAKEAIEERSDSPAPPVARHGPNVSVVSMPTGADAQQVVERGNDQQEMIEEGVPDEAPIAKEEFKFGLIGAVASVAFSLTDLLEMLRQEQAVIADLVIKDKDGKEIAKVSELRITELKQRLDGPQDIDHFVAEK